MKTLSPQKARRVLVGAGLLYMAFLAPCVGWELYTGRAKVTPHKGQPPIVYLKADDPVGYWQAIKEEVFIIAAAGFGLIGFGQFIVWLNRLPGSRKTWEE